MNSVHDMGGLQAFGPVQLEVNEPIFHAAWERQAMGLTVLITIVVAYVLYKSRWGRQVRAVVQNRIMAGAVGKGFNEKKAGKVFDLTGSYHAAFINGIGWNLLNIVIVSTMLLRLRIKPTS